MKIQSSIDKNKLENNKKNILLENKNAQIGSAAPLKTIDQILNTFAAFKEANDTRLAEIEKKMVSDCLTEEKIDRINLALDEQQQRLKSLAVKANRPYLNTNLDCNYQQDNHQKAFQNYLRNGYENNLKQIEIKSLNSKTGNDAGYLLPKICEEGIYSHLNNISPMRAIASTQQIGTNIYKKLVSITSQSANWVHSEEIRSKTDDSKMIEVELPAFEIYAMPAASQNLLDDNTINIESWLGEEIQQAFAEKESSAFVNGDGQKMPRGFLNYPTIDESKWKDQSIGTQTTDLNQLSTPNSSDQLLELVYSLKSEYRQNAKWTMNRKTQSLIRKLKDNNGNYLWEPVGGPCGTSLLMGMPLVELEAMPNFEPNACPIAFGDFSRGYLIVDRHGIKVLRDPYSNKPYVLFYTTKRVGGGVIDFNAIKLLKCIDKPADKTKKTPSKKKENPK